jgi:hypothetical protein
MSRSSVKQAGYAGILLLIIDMRPISHYADCVWQVAMEYLSSIIDNPFERPSTSDAEEEVDLVDPTPSDYEKGGDDRKL